MGTIVLADARTECERQVIDDWAKRTHPQARVQTVAQTDFERLPSTTDLVPARVVWLPPVRDGERRVSLADVAVPGLPGARRVEASATSPLDSYRGRS